MNWTQRQERRTIDPVGFGSSRFMSPRDYDKMLREESTRSSDLISEVQKQLRQNNPMRWRRLKSDIKWVDKRLIKMGIDPKNIRKFI